MGKSVNAHNGFRLDHVVLLPRQQIGTHQQDTWELSWVLRGEGMRTIGDTTEPFRSGDVVLVPPHLPHLWRFDDTDGTIENITIVIEHEFLHNMLMVLSDTSLPIEVFEHQTDAICFTGETQQNIMTILTQMEHQSHAMQVALLLQVLVLIVEGRNHQIVGRMEKTEQDKRLENIQIFLICNYQRQVTIDEIAHFVGMNRSAVCTFFHQKTGRTIMSTLSDIRLREATLLLSNTTLSIQEVCYKCGFQDVPHFCRLFKQRHGMTAKEWRQTNKK